jgi:2-polyprenyl-3-methyl-5-hydroxy-6-metoxy-1,4-benzoquinol methylase
MSDAVSQREREFWNEQARAAAPEAELLRVERDDRHDRTMPWLPYLGVPHFIQRLLDLVGDVNGRDVLDLGAGTGFLSALLARQGARVVALDVAEDQLAVARERARVSGVEHAVATRAAATEALPFPDGAFDAVVGSFVLHHVNLRIVAPEIRRVLRPAGRAVFLETSARNRLLMAARTYVVGRFGVPRASSPDEAPLDAAAERELGRAFPGAVRFHYPDVVFLRLLPAYVGVLRVAPVLWATKLADRTIGRIRPARTLGYFALVELRKDGGDGR